MRKLNVEKKELRKAMRKRKIKVWDEGSAYVPRVEEEKNKFWYPMPGVVYKKGQPLREIDKKRSKNYVYNLKLVPRARIEFIETKEINTW